MPPISSRELLLVPAGILGIAAGAQLSVPMVPVPMTMQSFFVVAVAGAAGARVGVAAAAGYVLAAAAGAPLLAGGAGGLAAVLGPTGGYLLAFPVAAGLAGWMTGVSGKMGRGRVMGGMLAGHAVILAVGTAWLAARIGTGAAVSAGLLPFLPGAVVKSALAAICVVALRRGATRSAAPPEAAPASTAGTMPEPPSEEIGTVEPAARRR